MAINKVGTASSITNSPGTATTNPTWNHTTVSGTDLLVVAVGTYRAAGNTVNSVTFDGTNLTQAVTNTNSGSQVEIWYLASPAIKTGAIVVTLANAGEHQHIAANFEGTTGTLSIGNTGTNSATDSNPTVNVISASGELVLGAWGGWKQGLTWTPSDTEIVFVDNGSDNDSISLQSTAGAATSTVNGILGGSVTWSAVGVAIQENASTPVDIYMPPKQIVRRHHGYRLY